MIAIASTCATVLCILPFLDVRSMGDSPGGNTDTPPIGGFFGAAEGGKNWKSKFLCELSLLKLLQTSSLVPKALILQTQLIHFNYIENRVKVSGRFYNNASIHNYVGRGSIAAGVINCRTKLPCL